LNPDLDHVALASRDVREPLDALVCELGALVLFGGQNVGFRFVQVRLGDVDAGMTVELLEPWDVERNDFLERFLSGRDGGAHHLTFKVDDLAATLARVQEAGFRPVQVDLSDPEWKEAFLHPREAHGTVVQLAESHGDFPTRAELLASVRQHGAEGHPRWWPEPPPRGPIAGVLRQVVLVTPSLPATTGFFAGLLGGTEAAAGEGWIELAWPGGGRVRLEEHPGASPGIDRLDVELPGAAGRDHGESKLTLAGTRIAVTPA
jgi:methylmalonyl-CoA/ethylmalonyl-CoA epimerase